MADYVKPFDATDPNASFVNGNPSAGVAGSIPDALMWEVWQRELKNLIVASGQTASNADLTQVLKAVQAVALTRVINSGQVPVITPNVTLYVRSDGNDATADGTANTAAKAFATIAAALQSASRFTNTSTVTIQLGIPGNYAAPNTLPKTGASFQILGDEANKASYVIQGAGLPATGPISVQARACSWRACGSSTQATPSRRSSPWRAVRSAPATSGSRWGRRMRASHALAFLGGQVIHNGGTEFASGAGGMASATAGGNVAFDGSISVTGNPGWTAAGVSATSCGTITVTSGTAFSGTAFGSRYSANTNGAIDTALGGENLFPGSSAGTKANGGQYV